MPPADQIGGLFGHHQHRRIDMGELGIAVGVVGPLSRLAIGLTTVVQLPQQVGDDALAGLEALFSERLDEVTLAAADLTQRRTRIAADGVLDQRLKRRRQIRLVHHGALASTPSTADPAADLVAARSKLPNPAIDGAPRQAGRLRNCRDAAIAVRKGLIRRQ